MPHSPPTASEPCDEIGRDPPKVVGDGEGQGRADLEDVTGRAGDGDQHSTLTQGVDQGGGPRAVRS